MSGTQDAFEALVEVLARGELGNAPSSIADHRRGPAGAGRTLLLRSLVAGLDRSMAEPPSLEETLTIEAAPAMLSRICTLEERRSFAALDVRGMDQWRSARPPPETPREAVDARLCELRRAVLRGEPVVPELEESLGRAATASGVPEAVIEHTALSALSALSKEQLDEAVRLARRASRMSRTEGLLAQEYLANLVLARLRRHSGRPHLASRILSALTIVCPVGWRGWLAWELAMVGRAKEARRALCLADGADCAATAARSLLAALEAAQKSDAATLDVEARTLLSIASEVGLVATDVAAILSALDAEQHVSAWRASIDGVPPVALSGLTAPPSRPSPHGTEIWIVWDAERGARRMLRAAIGLRDSRLTEFAETVPPRNDRAHAAAAALALAGSAGLPIEQLYQTVFGGVYDAVQCDGMVRTTLYRARQQLEGRAEIERSAGRVVLRPLISFAVPDPSATPGTEDRILRTLAAKGGRASAKELAEAVGVSVRSAQDALKVLVQEGACDQARIGRRIEYVLEDTTFGQPTLHRLTPRGVE